MNFDSFNVLKVQSPSRHNHQCCPQHRQQNLSWWKIEKIIGEFARWDQISNITFFTADKLAPFPRIHKKLYHRTIGDGSQREPERDNSCRHGIGGLCRYFGVFVTEPFCCETLDYRIVLENLGILAMF